MRKWTYLVAALLMAGATTTFTGCIDNDEPEGIENLRGAKAELLKAKAAVELANEAMIRANVANQELKNKAQEITNKQQEIALEMDKLELAIEESNSAAKIAEYKLQLQKWENQKALEAEQFKATMLAAQTATAWAQKQYDDALAAIEAAKLMLSDEELAVVEYAQGRVAAKATALASAHTALNDAAMKLNQAYETTEVTETKEGLELEIAKAQVTLDVAKTAQGIVEELIAKNIDTFAGWEKEVKELETKIGIQDTIIAQAKIDKKKIEESAEGKAAKAAVTKATEAVTKAGDNKTKVYAGEEVDGKSFTFKLDKYSHSVASNKAITEILNATNVGDLATTSYANGVFSYVGESYNQNTYNTNKGTASEKALTEMIALVSAAPGSKAEDLAWATLELNKEKAILAKAETAYDKTVEEWKKAVEDYKNGKDYTEAAYKVAVSEANGVLTDIKAGKYTGTTEVQKAAQKIAYDAYVSFYNTMVANGQVIPAVPASVKDYTTLFTYLGANAESTLLPSAYTPVTEETRKATLMTKSKAAFGILYMFSGNPRLTLPTNVEIAAEQKKVADGTTTNGDYNALGAVWAGQDKVKHYNDIIGQSAAMQELKATLVAQQTLVVEKVAANTTAVKAYDTKLAEAKADLKAKEDAEKALYAEVDARSKKATELRKSYDAIMGTITEELKGIADNATTVEEVKAALAGKLNEAKDGVIAAEVALKDAKTKLEHFEAGKYDKKYQLEVLTVELERAQARFNEAQSIYEKALADLNAIIAKLIK